MDFEAYRDLIRMKSLELPEGEVLQLAEKEGVEMRAAAKAAATQAVTHPYSEFNGAQTASNISSGAPNAYPLWHCYVELRFDGGVWNDGGAAGGWTEFRERGIGI